MLSKQFLQSKVSALLDYWQHNDAFGWGGVKCDSERFIHTPTQAYETESGGLRFILWNLIRGFYGHYECVVNTETFEYSVKQHSGFGSLTWTTSPTDMKIYHASDLTNEQKREIEASIATTILRCLPIYKPYYPINVVSKHIQHIAFKRVCSDNLAIQQP